MEVKASETMTNHGQEENLEEVSSCGSASYVHAHIKIISSATSVNRSMLRLEITQTLMDKNGSSANNVTSGFTVAVKSKVVILTYSNFWLRMNPSVLSTSVLAAEKRRAASRSIAVHLLQARTFTLLTQITLILLATILNILLFLQLIKNNQQLIRSRASIRIP